MGSRLTSASSWRALTSREELRCLASKPFFCPFAALRRRARRPQLKRDPLGGITVIPTSSSDDDTWRLLTKLFRSEVPEIASGVVEIRAVARRPGVGCKVAIYSYDRSVDGVGACVGPRASRVQRVVEQLGGERVDLSPWADSPDRLISLALRRESRTWSWITPTGARSCSSAKIKCHWPQAATGSIVNSRANSRVGTFSLWRGRMPPNKRLKLPGAQNREELRCLAGQPFYLPLRRLAPASVAPAA